MCIRDSPCSYPHSTIGGSRLNFRVRNGNGCDPAPMATGNMKFEVRRAKFELVCRGPPGVSHGGLHQIVAAEHTPAGTLPTSRRPWRRSASKLTISTE